MSSRNDSLTRLIGELGAFSRLRIALALFFTLAVAVLEGSGLLLLAPLLSGVLGLAQAGAPKTPGLLAGLGGFGLAAVPMILGLYVLIMALHGLLSWQRDLRLAALQADFLGQLRQQLFSAIGAAEWSFLARMRGADFSHAMVTDLGRVSLGVSALMQLLSTAILALVYVLVALRLSPAVTACTLLAGGLLLLSQRHHHRQVHQRGFRLTTVTRQHHQEVSEFLAGLRFVKANNLARGAARRYADKLALERAESVDYAGRLALSRSQLRVGGALALALLTGISLTWLHVPGPSVLVLVLVFSRLLPNLSAMQQAFERLLHALPAYTAFAAMRAHCLAHAEPGDAGGEDRHTPAPPFAREIRLQGVGYQPVAGAPKLLSDIDLCLPARATTALVGPSGAGKSTLAEVLAGLLVPTAGRILIDGVRLADADRRGWRDRVAYVAQETFLLNASLRDNLAWVEPGLDEAAIWTALEQASAAGFVRALPLGLDTVLGERGIRLSGGERQRVAIARALLRRPQLLILDEASSALDRDHERLIQESIAQLHGQLTILIIAHRLPTIQGTDQIVVLDQGRVREVGTWPQLLAAPTGWLAGAVRRDQVSEPPPPPPAKQATTV